jgi:hypothetical protein
MLKLNFWQWLGVVLLIIGVAWYVYNKSKGSGTTGRTMAEPVRALIGVGPLTLSR